MNNQSKSSLRGSVVLGALLLLAATTSGCGVGLPTQPSVDQSVVKELSAGTASDGQLEVGDPGEGDDYSGGPGPGVPHPEIVIPGTSGPPAGGGGLAYGHLKKKNKN